MGLDLDAAFKLAASSVHRKTRMQESRGGHGQQLGMWTAGDGSAPLDSRMLAFLKAELAGNFIAA